MSTEKNKIKIPVPTTVNSDDVASLKAQLKEAKEAINIFKTKTATSLISLESDLKRMSSERKSLAEKMSHYPSEFKFVKEPHKTIFGEEITRRVPDYSVWTKDQLKVRDRYNELKEKMRELRETLIAVTLIDDPDVTDVSLNCGVNGEMLALYYSGSKTIEVDDETSLNEEPKRVQLIPYKHYAALMTSYRVKFKSVEDTNGRLTNKGIKLRPILEATLPTEDMLRKHHELIRDARRNSIHQG